MRNKLVDDYIASKPPALRPALEKMRAIITAAAPGAEEAFSYMIPCYKYHGMLVGFGVHKKGCSFYVMNPKMLSSFATELTGYEYTGSTVHLAPGQPVPVALIKKITRLRIKENEEMAALKKMLQSDKSKKRKPPL